MNRGDIIKDFLVKEIILNSENKNIGIDDSLIEAGIIDSLGILKLITFLEREFSIRVKDEEVLPENFENIRAISSFIDKKINK